MPVMNGWLFREKQLQDPALAAIPVIVLSANPAAAEAWRATGVADALAKPVDTDKLLAVVAEHC
jgi:CheY-like chemotaxis protein